MPSFRTLFLNLICLTALVTLLFSLPPAGVQAVEKPVPQEVKNEETRVYRHAVMFAFKESASKDDIQKIVDGFRALPKKIDTIIDFEYGTNVSPEKHGKGLTHFFLVTFKDKKGLAVYLPHAAHQEFVKLLKPSLKDVTVFDYWAQK